jgi:hypothetical protein
MKKPRDPDALLSAYLAGGMEVLPDRVADAVLAEIHRTRQRAVFGPWTTRSMFKPSLAVAAVVAVLVAGALFTTRRDQPEIGNPSPSLPGVAAPSSTPSGPTATPSAEASPTPDPTSLELTWNKVALDGPTPTVAWIGDRFVLVDEDSGEVSTSTDGLSWQAPDADPGYLELLRGEYVISGSDVVGWWNPEDGPDYTNKPAVTARDVLQIFRPPAGPTKTTPWKGRIHSIAIGPVGIVAQVHSHLDTDAWIASKLGDDWVSRYEEVSFKDGILEITMKRGRGLKVVWADEGFEPGDFQDAGFGWFSPDGVEWTQMPVPTPDPDVDGQRGFTTGFGDVVGVSDGFIARGPEGMWHSSDGLTWRNLGNPDADFSSDGSVLVPWMGGALVSDGVGRFDFWTSQGHTELPMAADVRAASKQPNEPRDNAIGTGPLGAAMVSIDSQEILVTRDGIDWDIQPMPAEMAADGVGRFATTVAVGERSVLVLLWAGVLVADQVPSLWLGTPEP